MKFGKREFDSTMRALLDREDLMEYRCSNVAVVLCEKVFELEDWCKQHIGETTAPTARPCQAT
jgi:hypothetical protein